MIRYKSLLIVMILAAFILAGCGGGNVVATVNGEEITRQQLDENLADMKKMWESQGLNFEGEEAQAMLKMLEAQALSQLIDQELLLQEAAKHDVKPTRQQVEAEIKNFKGNFENEAKFKQFLAANGLSEPQLFDLVERDMTMQELQKIVMADVKTADATEAKAYYEEHKDEFAEPEKREVRHILIKPQTGGDAQKAEVEAKTEALAILEQLNQGQDFATLAKEKSHDLGTKENGGLYTFGRGEAVPEFEEAAFALKIGEITGEPVKTTFGYHIIKLEKIIPASVNPYDSQIEEYIIKTLNDEIMNEKFTEYMAGLREKADIKNSLTKESDNKESGNEEGNSDKE